MYLTKQTIATTHRGRHGDVITRELLEDIAEQLSRRCVPVIYEHDPRIPPLGRTRSAEVVQFPDGHHALVVTSEMFDRGDVVPPLDGNPSIKIGKLNDGISLVVDGSHLNESNRKVLAELPALDVTIERPRKKSLELFRMLALAFRIMAQGFLQKMGADFWDADCDVDWSAVWTRVRNL